MRGLDFLLAARALHEAEGDARFGPLLLHLSVQAVQMKDVLALQLHAWLSSQSFSVADHAVGVSVVAEGERFVLLDAVRVETGEAVLFVLEAAAGVSAGEQLLAGLAHHLDAAGRAADVDEGRQHGGWGLGELVRAEAALALLLVLLELLAVLAQVVRLALTLAAEVLLALAASDSELAHVHCCFPRELQFNNK